MIIVIRVDDDDDDAYRRCDCRPGWKLAPIVRCRVGDWLLVVARKSRTVDGEINRSPAAAAVGDERRRTAEHSRAEQSNTASRGDMTGQRGHFRIRLGVSLACHVDKTNRFAPELYSRSFARRIAAAAALRTRTAAENDSRA